MSIFSVNCRASDKIQVKFKQIHRPLAIYGTQEFFLYTGRMDTRKFVQCTSILYHLLHYLRLLTDICDNDF